MEVRSISTITVKEIVCVLTGLCQVQTERSWAIDPGTALYTVKMVRLGRLRLQRVPTPELS